jgi:hypothetical protein
MSRRKSRIPVFYKKNNNNNNNEKEEFSPSLQVVFSIVDRSQFRRILTEGLNVIFHQK